MLIFTIKGLAPQVPVPLVIFRYLLFSDITCHCEALCRFGEDWRVLLKLARGE